MLIESSPYVRTIGRADQESKEIRAVLSRELRWRKDVCGAITKEVGRYAEYSAVEARVLSMSLDLKVRPSR
jgi:hypothetical protein